MRTQHRDFHVAPFDKPGSMYCPTPRPIVYKPHLVMRNGFWFVNIDLQREQFPGHAKWFSEAKEWCDRYNEQRKAGYDYILTRKRGLAPVCICSECRRDFESFAFAHEIRHPRVQGFVYRGQLTQNYIGYPVVTEVRRTA